MTLLFPRRPWNKFRACLTFFPLLLVLTGCGADVSALSVAIPALPSEDAIGPCSYDIVMDSSTTQKGVLVIFERADTVDLYQSQTLRDAVKALRFSIIWAHQCNSKNTGDLQPDARQGPTRMLFSALDAFSQLTNHPELATTGVMLYGFSAAGVLTATMANDHPQRLLGRIQYAAGSANVDLDSVDVPAATAAIPALILANADDNASGTSRSYRYFQRGRAQGAPWAYAVQNSTTHCCNLSTLNVILPWIQVISQTNPTNTTLYSPKSRIGKGKASEDALASYFVCTADGVKDGYGETDCKFTAASLGPASPTAPVDSGWLPDQASGAAWLAWVTNAVTN